VNKAAAAITMWCDIDPLAWTDFENWHVREHLPERMGVDGFVRGTRWRSESRSHGVFVLYELEDLSAFQGPSYQQRLNDPTPWTKRVMPAVKNMMRTPSRITQRTGAGLGNSLLTLGMRPRLGSEEDLRGWLSNQCTSALIDLGASSVILLEADKHLPRASTAEHALRGVEDQVGDWCLLVDNYQRAARDQMAEHLETTGMFRRAELDGTVQAERYSFEYMLAKDEL
jgi:hypothetical protein